MYIMYIWIHIDHFRNALETSRSSSPLDFGALPFIRPPSWRDQHQNVAKKKNANKKILPNGEKNMNQTNQTIQKCIKMYQNVGFWDTKINMLETAPWASWILLVQSPLASISRSGSAKKHGKRSKKGDLWLSVSSRLMKNGKWQMMTKMNFLNDKWRRMSEKWQLMNDDRWQYWVMNDDRWRVYDDCWWINDEEWLMNDEWCLTNTDWQKNDWWTMTLQQWLKNEWWK